MAKTYEDYTLRLDQLTNARKNLERKYLTTVIEPFKEKVYGFYMGGDNRLQILWEDSNGDYLKKYLEVGTQPNPFGDILSHQIWICNEKGIHTIK